MGAQCDRSAGPAQDAGPCRALAGAGRAALPRARADDYVPASSRRRGIAAATSYFQTPGLQTPGLQTSRQRFAVLTHVFDIVQQLALPAVLFAVMVTVGMELTQRDFRDLAAAPRAALAGITLQASLFPAIALLVLAVAPLSPATAIGLAIVAACPSGGFSNVLTLLGRGDLALSISLTSISSILAVVTLPVLLPVALGVAGLGGAAVAGGVEVPLGPTLGQLALVVLLPVGLGMWLRARHPAWVQRHIDRAQQISQIALYAIVLLMAVQDWRPFSQGIEASLPLGALLFAGSAGAGFVMARAILPAEQAFTIAIETGTRNVGLATLVAVSVLGKVEWAAFGAVYILPASALGFAAALVHRRMRRRARAAAAKAQGLA